MLRVALTHDVDRVNKSYQYITYTLRNLLNFKFNDLKYHILSIFKEEPYWNFPEIIRIEKNYNVKSTFYFLNESIRFNLFNPSNWKLSLGRYKIDAEPVKCVIKWLDTNGWEIGLHGSYKSYINKDMLAREKFILDSILGHEVMGIRQHYLNLERNITWRIQKDVGFKYDTTFGLKNDIGFAENIHTPFRPFNDNFIVFPMIIMDDCFMKISNKSEKLKELLDECDKFNAIFVINWHQRAFNENEFLNFKDQYIQIIEECLRRNAIFKTLSQFYNDIE